MTALKSQTSSDSFLFLNGHIEDEKEGDNLGT